MWPFKTSGPRCPICQSGKVKAITSKEVFGTEFTVYQCQRSRCMHGFVLPLPTVAFLEKVYAAEKLNAYQLDDKVLQAVDEFFMHLFTNYIPQGRKTPGTLLDVGAGLGTFMHAANKSGWRVHGIEFNKESVDIGKKLFDLDIVHGNFYKLEDYFPGMKFDLINMNHVFEHVLQPREYLRYLSGFLNPGGCLLITVPNILSDDYRKLGAKWSYIHIPEHISYFSRHSMDRLFLAEKNTRVAADRYVKIFQSSFNSPQQREGEGLTSMYRLESTAS